MAVTHFELTSEWHLEAPLAPVWDLIAATEGRAFGELDGTGLWTFEGTPQGMVARYLWRVEVTRPWMRWMAPVLAPVFAWNHHKVMAWGEEGARKRLGIG